MDFIEKDFNETSLEMAENLIKGTWLALSFGMKATLACNLGNPSRKAFLQFHHTGVIGMAL